MDHCLEVMHERIAHNFSLDLAAAASTPVALQAPDTGDWDQPVCFGTAKTI